MRSERKTFEWSARQILSDPDDPFVTGAELLKQARKADAELAALQQERDALLEALEHVVAVLPSPIWNEHQVLVWSQLDIEKMRAALATSQKGA